MAVPAYLVDYIKQQLFSKYPNCQIEEVEDYNIFDSQGYARHRLSETAEGQHVPHFDL